MKISVETLDGALGYSLGDTPNFIIGPAAQGSTTEVQTLGEPSTLKSLFLKGKLLDRSSFTFARGVAPLSLLRMGASTAGSIGQPVKTPASSTGTLKSFFGALRVAGADKDGNVLYIAKQTGVTVAVVNDSTNNQTLLASATGKAVTIRVATSGMAATTTTGTQLAAYSLPADVAALISIVALGTGASVIGTVAATSLDKGGLSITPKTQYVRFKFELAGSSAASLAAAKATGTDANGNASTDITVTLGTDANSQDDPTKNTATLVKAALEGVTGASSLYTVELVGDGTGMVGRATSFQELTYGSTGWAAVSGTPNDHYALALTFPAPGGVGVGTFRLATDDGVSYGPETQIPGDGVYVVPDTGLTITFSGSWDLNDKVTCAVVGPSSTSGDLLAALAVLSGLSGDGGELAVTGAITGAMAASLASWIASEKAAGRDWQVYAEARDYSSSSETLSAYVTSLRSDFGTVLEPDGSLSVTPGWWPHVIPGEGELKRRPFAWAAVAQCWRLPYYVHPSAQQDGGGALPGLYTQLTPAAPRTHDERRTPGLGGSLGRMMTIQSMPGADVIGQWFVGDASGLRSPGTMAAATSDWSLLPEARLANRARRAVRAFAAKIVAGRYATKTNGTLTDAARLSVQEDVEAYMRRVLGGAVQSLRTVVSATEPVKTSKRLPFTVYLNNWARPLEVLAKIGLEPVT